jgi:hypothetical protein
MKENYMGSLSFETCAGVSCLIELRAAVLEIQNT